MFIQGITQPKFCRFSFEYLGSCTGLFIPTFHQCGTKGHIRPRCFQLTNETQP